MTPSEAQFNNQVSLSSGSFGYVIIEDDTGTPGLVCDDEFADSNAGCEVVCRQLGLQYDLLLFLVHQNNVHVLTRYRNRSTMFLCCGSIDKHVNRVNSLWLLPS